MKRYFKYEDPDSFVGGGTRFVEADDGVAVREVTVRGNCYLGSNLYYPHWGVMLAEGKTDYESIDVVQEVTQTEFEHHWEKLLAADAARWEIIRVAYSIGTPVQGYVEVIQPLGVIINLGDGAVLGVANYDNCYRAAEDKLFGRLNRVRATVAGYNEELHWLELSSPEVFSERVTMPYWWN